MRPTISSAMPVSTIPRSAVLVAVDLVMLSVIYSVIYLAVEAADHAYVRALIYNITLS